VSLSPNTAAAAAAAIRRGHKAPGHDDGDACEELASRLDRETSEPSWEQAEPTFPDMPLTPLEMAREWSKRVGQIAEHYERRERAEPGFGRMEARIEGAGRQQFEAAQMASYMATVSIAEDLHRVVAIMTGEAAGLLDEKWAREAGQRSGAVDDARATREHMRDWTGGGSAHLGEEP
jgi:hypothetical protein